MTKVLFKLMPTQYVHSICILQQYTRVSTYALPCSLSGYGPASSPHISLFFTY